jgi:transcriptional regulator with XRE-family HTH domain
MSKSELLEKLTSKEYRDSFISEEIDVGLPMQIREMRESRGWKQGEVAEKIGTQQPRFSVMEKLGYGNYSLNTLKKIASVFDVALIVSFVPYSEMIDFTDAINRKRLSIPTFSDEYAQLANRYARSSSQVQTDTTQGHLDFSGSTVASPIVSRTTATESAISESANTVQIHVIREDVPIPYLVYAARTGEGTHV